MAQHRGTVVFYTIEAFGHINPLLQMGKVMRNQGYRVVLLTTFPMQWSDQVRETGIELDYCFDQPIEKQNAMRSRMVDTVVVPSPIESFRNLFKPGGIIWHFLTNYIEHEAQIESKLQSYQPDLLVYDQISGLPCLIKTAPKYVRVFSGFPSELFRCYNDNCVAGQGLRLEEMTARKKKEEHEVLIEFRDRLRQHWRLKNCTDWPNDLDLSPSSPDLNFYFGPQELGLEKVAEFHPLPSSWFRLEHIIPLDEKEREFKLPECLANLPGKLIYFSLGSTCIRGKTGLDAMNRMLEIMSKSPHRFIVSMGQMHAQVKLHPNMWGREFVDQKAILPMVDLYITHGGHNSTMEAFYYGVPGQIVVPIAGDQFDCAQRIEDCGFGKRLSLYECTDDELLGTIESLLANQELKEKMKSIGERLRGIDYAKIAADKLGALIGGASSNGNCNGNSAL